MKKILIFLLFIIAWSSCKNKGKSNHDKEQGKRIESSFDKNINVGELNKKGIEFSSESFDKAIKISRELNKPIFIDFYTHWCGPCKRMDNFVFTDSIIGDFYNKNFICLKIDAEKGEGIALANKFGVQGYPTLLFLTPNLEIKLKHFGYRGTKNFLELGYTVIDGKSSNDSVLNSLSNYDSKVESLFEFSSSLNYYSRQSEKDSALFDYFKDIPKNKWYTPQYFHFIENQSYSIFSPLSEFVIANRNKYSKLYGKTRIDKFISRLMSFAIKTPKDLYGKSYNNFSNDEIYSLLYSELEKIDFVFTNKNKLNHEIILLCKSVRDNNKDWNSLFTKVDYYNKHYSQFDKEWYNFPNNWYTRALMISPINLEIKNYNETCLKLAKSKLTDRDFNEFAKGLSIGTVERFVSNEKQSENTKNELTIALSTLTKLNPVSKVWANEFLSKINMSDEDIINYKEKIIKNAL
ncbi:thioredoxin family protein [Pontimicrobium aquaticum]|uniref:DUF255 domain-containing protein n=1 Tax=Pontimicrobium aquaticum TaxID=2565367 RepID=A0A4U0EUL8_9FLAO|nr:thioredoxin family protein [Pontimicrobium aquaticum]TJY34102.1 DUF255 domain-containing protein [Pontimicrobium aquaticum]